MSAAQAYKTVRQNDPPNDARDGEKMIPCDWHKPKGLGYISWFQWADQQTSKGNEQIQCDHCKHWFFRSEYGKPRLNSRDRGEE